MGVRVEVATTGIDDGLQGLSADYLRPTLPTRTGLRIPSFRPDDVTRYLFLLATRTVSKPTRVRGIRQMLTIGASLTVNNGDAGNKTQVVELPVTDPFVYAPDGNVSWHLVSEPNPRPNMTVPVTGEWVQGSNFAYVSADSPALLFQTAGFSAAQSQYYWQNLNAYAPPTIGSSEWQPLGGLGTFHDIRFPWLAARAWDSLDIPFCVEGERRVSLYASVLQTSGFPSTYTSTPTGTQTASFGQAPDFANTIANVSGATPSAVIFWRVGGAIIFEDYDCGCDDSERGA